MLTLDLVEFGWLFWFGMTVVEFCNGCIVKFYLFYLSIGLRFDVTDWVKFVLLGCEEFDIDFVGVFDFLFA